MLLIVIILLFINLNFVIKLVSYYNFKKFLIARMLHQRTFHCDF